MQVSVIIFSADEIRGNVLSKVFKKGGQDCLLHKTLVDFEAVSGQLSPDVIVLDNDSFFSKELESLAGRLTSGVAAHIVLLSESDDSILSTLASAHCPLAPFDPEWIFAEAVKLIGSEKKSIVQSASLIDTLRNYLRLK